MTVDEMTKQAQLNAAYVAATQQLIFEQAAQFVVKQKDMPDCPEDWKQTYEAMGEYFATLAMAARDVAHVTAGHLDESE
jgi:hypothetical protein